MKSETLSLKIIINELVVLRKTMKRLNKVFIVACEKINRKNTWFS